MCPRRRTPDLEGSDRLPRVPTRPWWRVCALLEARGWVPGPQARMARFLARWADERGCVADVPGLYRAYAEDHGVSTRTAATDLRRVEAAGWLRCTASNAPGRSARYVLCVDPEQIPDDLPGDLARVVRHLFAGPPERTPDAGRGESGLAGSDATAPRCVAGMPRARGHALLADCVLWRYGSATGPARATGVGIGMLHVLPLTREGHPPPHTARHRTTRPGPSRAQHRASSSDEERRLAEVVLDRCGPAWRAQRGPGRAELGPAERERLVPLVAGALRYQASSDVIEELTRAVASARSLAAVLITRTRRVIHASRAARRVEARADQTGELYNVKARVAATTRAAHQPGAAAQDALSAARAACRAVRSGCDPEAAQRATRPRTAPSPGRGASERVDAPVLGAGAGGRPGLWEIETAARRAASATESGRRGDDAPV